MSEEISIDYRELLKRYIEHVTEYEGVDFIASWQSPQILSDEDVAELTKLSDEIYPTISADDLPPRES